MDWILDSNDKKTKERIKAHKLITKGAKKEGLIALRDECLVLMYCITNEMINRGMIDDPRVQEDGSLYYLMFERKKRY